MDEELLPPSPGTPALQAYLTAIFLGGHMHNTTLAAYLPAKSHCHHLLFLYIYNTDNYRCIKHRAITKCNSIHNHNKHNIKNKTTYWLID